MFHGAREREWPLERQLALIGRAMALRRAGRFPVLRTDEGRISICEAPGGVCAGGGCQRRVLRWAQLELLVEEAEGAAAARKGMGREGRSALSGSRSRGRVQ